MKTKNRWTDRPFRDRYLNLAGQHTLLNANKDAETGKRESPRQAAPLGDRGRMSERGEELALKPSWKSATQSSSPPYSTAMKSGLHVDDMTNNLTTSISDASKTISTSTGRRRSPKRKSWGRQTFPASLLSRPWPSGDGQAVTRMPDKWTDKDFVIVIMSSSSSSPPPLPSSSLVLLCQTIAFQSNYSTENSVRASAQSEGKEKVLRTAWRSPSKTSNISIESWESLASDTPSWHQLIIKAAQAAK